jgi:hypothetical protein
MSDLERLSLLVETIEQMVDHAGKRLESINDEDLTYAYNGLVARLTMMKHIVQGKVKSIALSPTKA